MGEKNYLMDGTIGTKKQVAEPESSQARPAMVRAFDPLPAAGTGKPQSYLRRDQGRFAEERDLRLGYRPEGPEQYMSDLEGDPTWRDMRSTRTPHGLGNAPRLRTTPRCCSSAAASPRCSPRPPARARRGEHPHRRARRRRRRHLVLEPLSRRRLRCVAYDYLPLLDEMNYVPGSFYAKGPEIFAHCQAIARKYDLYDLAVFQTTVTSTVWDAKAKLWRIGTDRGDTMSARFVICANGTLSKPKLSKIEGMETLQGPFLPLVALRLRLTPGPISPA